MSTEQEMRHARLEQWHALLGIGLAIFLVAGVVAAVGFFAGRSWFPSDPPRPVGAGEPPEPRPIAAELVTAIRDANVKAVRQLLDTGADVNARDAQGNSPLILAALYASPECVGLLIEKGADVNAATRPAPRR